MPIIALMLLLAPAVAYLASLPFTRRLSPLLRRTYRLLGAVIALGGPAVTVYLTMYGGDQGGIAAYFFQLGVIAAFILLSAQTVAIYWISKPAAGKDQRKRLAWVLVAVLILLVLGFVYPRVKDFILIDRCLDSGGTWDSARSECRH
jgi:hypothetical protein